MYDFKHTRFIEDYPELDNKKVELWIDCDGAVEILKFIFEKDRDNNYKRRKHFFVILNTLLQNKYDEDLYSKEEVSYKAKNVTAMKFKGKPNIRIACKEFFTEGKKL